MKLTEAVSPPWHIAVVIPARNEEDLLPRCLQSVLAACSALPHGTTSDVVVASDCSSDGTTRIATAMLMGSGTVVETWAGNVGVARAAAARTALVRFRRGLHGDLSRCWVANTDADCEVPEHWLLQQVLIAQQGYHAVTGVVDVDCFSEHEAAVEARFRASYLIHADGTHPHVHGANMGVRADAYLRAGGWSALATAEDHDLWSRLKQSGAPQCTEAALSVQTSGRRTGRAPLGFAKALAAHNADATGYVPA